MKKWICYNLFGHDTDTFGMISGLSLVGFLEYRYRKQKK